MIALDANILIYACDKADLKRQQVALDLVSNARDGVLLWQVACEFVAASRKLRSQGFTMAGAWHRVLRAEDGWSFWDAMIVAACLECRVTRLYSEDLPGRAVRWPLETVNPFLPPG